MRFEIYINRNGTQKKSKINRVVSVQFDSLPSETERNGSATKYEWNIMEMKRFK